MSALQRPQVLAARAFAIEAHGEQKRKYTGEPYWHHCEEVAKLVDSTGAPVYVVAAAYLHDVIEDTERTYADIAKTFGVKVADLVLEVTDVSRPEHGNRAARKEIDLAHLANASPDGMTIKLADLIDNARSIVACDPSFSEVYLYEKQAQLFVLRAGHQNLWVRAAELLRDGIAKIGGAA